MTASVHRPWFGIHFGMWLALLRAYLLMDFRAQHYQRATGAKATESISPLFWVVGQFLLASGIAGAILFARVDAFFFALVGLSVSTLLTGASIVVEFHEIIVSPRDIEILGHQPVPIRTYSAARLANLLAYILLMTAAANVFPALMGVWLADAGWMFLPAYAAACLLGNLFVAGVLILLYTAVLRRDPVESGKDALAWTQIVLVMVCFYGAQAVLRDSQHRLEMFAYRLPDWVMYFPLAWLARFVDSFYAQPDSPAWWVLWAAVTVVLAVWAAAVRGLSNAYSRLQPAGSAWRDSRSRALPHPGDLADWCTRRVTRPGAERAVYWLCSAMMQRDGELRMRIWPLPGTVAALLLFGLFTNQLADPFAVSGSASVLPVASIFLLPALAPALIHSLRFSTQHDASWVLAMAPVDGADAYAEAVRKTVTYRVFVPVLAVLFIVFGIAWKHPLHALVHVAVGWLAVEAAGYVSVRQLVKGPPFSLAPSRGTAMGSIVLFASAVNACALMLGVGYHLAARSRWGLLAFVSLLCLLTASLGHWGHARRAPGASRD